MIIVQSSFWLSFWAAFHFRIIEVCSFSAWYLLLLAHSFWMLLEASFRADINLLDECLQIQNQANMYIKSHRFCVTPIVPESFMIISSINVLVQLFLMVGGFGRRSYRFAPDTSEGNWLKPSNWEPVESATKRQAPSFNGKTQIISNQHSEIHWVQIATMQQKTLKTQRCFPTSAIACDHLRLSYGSFDQNNDKR